MTSEGLIENVRRLLNWKPARITLGAVGSVGLAYVAMRQMDWGQVFQTFQEFPISWALVGIGGIIFSAFLRAFRWRVLLVKEKTSTWNLFLVQNAGIGANNLLPIRMLSEPIQLALVTKKYGLPAPTALATLVTEHVLDIFATAILMGVGVAFIPQLRGLSIQLTGALILFVVSLGVLLIVARGVDRLPFAGRISAIRRFGSALSTLQRSRKRVLASFLATVAHWVFLGMGGWALAHGLGMNIGLGAMVVLFLATTFFTSAVPSLPGAIGTFEFAVMYTLGFFDVDKTMAFSFAVVMHFLMFALPTTIALIVLPRAGLGLFSWKGHPPPRRHQNSAH